MTISSYALTRFRVRRFKHDATVNFHETMPRPFEESGPRGSIRELSYRSRKRLAFVARNTEVEFNCFMTLTYHSIFAGLLSGPAVKRHLKRVLAKINSRSWRNDFENCGHADFLWFMEFTKKGVPHFHVLLKRDHSEEAKRVSAKRIIFPRQTEALSVAWADIVERDVMKRFYPAVSKIALEGKVFEKMRRASASIEPILKPDGAARYVSKYAYKTEQKIVPIHFLHPGRFWGCTKAVTESVEPMFTEIVQGYQLDSRFDDGVKVQDGPNPVPFTVQFGQGINSL